ncbi:MAG: GNAT family N-acetyltransferase [Pseudomonadota bacterium]
MARHVPTINTARVTLRAMRPGEFDRFAEIWAMPEITHYVGGSPRARDASWKSFLNIAGHWQVTGFGQWGIEDHSTKQLVGQVGFFYGARGLGDDFDSVPEAGWVLAPEAQGRGLGIEAAQAAHDWFDRVVTGPLVCMIDPAHSGSVRIADQLGYVDMRVTEDEAGPIQLKLRKSPPQA